MTSFTPGPWSLSDETIRDGLRSKLLHGMPEGMLAIIRVEHQGKYYGDANARLIAAAPDLLESLKLFLNEYVNLVNSGDAGFWDRETEEKVIKARAAIAKAEGR